ncbi:MAG: hypothetical protein N2689_13360 [Verrucomicrobiae bacterium]|nr:hypothetical protein [Verrucomicrobiae bacterium]
MSLSHHCHGCLTRRECLKLLSASALGAAAVPQVLAARKSESHPADYVDAAKLRPRPEVRMSAAIFEKPRPYWLGWPGTTYDLDGHQKEYKARLADSSRRLGITTQLEARPINDEAGVGAFIEKLKTEKPHAALIILQEIHCWPWVNRVAKEAGVPLLVFAPVGVAFTGHVLRISREPGVYVASTLEWAAVEDGMRMVRAKRLFEETRVLWIRRNERNETVMERLGTKVRAIPRDTFNQRFDKQPVTAEVRDVASDMRRHAKRIVEPTHNDCLNSARAYVTAKRLMADEQANALSMDCLGMVGAKLVPTPPCMSWAMLMDQGITAGCEADLFGAFSLMMTSYLLNRPGFMNDPVPETYKNLLIVAHCTSGTRIRGFDKPAAPYILRNHSESALGVSVQVLWPVGEPVTLVRFSNANEMIIDTGKVVSNVQTPPAGGCRTSVEVAMDNIEDCRDVKGFHQVVTLGNHRSILEGFCQLYGIKVVRSPMFRPEPEVKKA